MTDHKLQVIPLGGLGEFGMNMTAIRYAEDMIVVDSGMMFPDAELLGVDLVMPDLTFLKDNQGAIRALILTHGHEDHIGAVPYFLSEIDVPVYGTDFTLALVDRRLEEYELEQEPRFIHVKPKQMVEIGPFKIEFVHVTHSIVSAVALAITTPLGVIVHTGDFKVDPTPTDNELFDLHTLAEYGKRGVLLLLSDSTNADRPGYTESERAVRPRFEEIFARSERRVIVSCFSSSIHRIQLVLDLAQEYNRRVAVFGRSMTTVTEIAHSLGLLEIPDGILLRPQDAMDLPPEKVAILISGTQGEPMSALARVAVDNHKHVSVEAGDMVVLSSRIIPGNEKSIFRMIDHMSRRGADVLYGSTNPPLHVSGHASVEEMKLILNLCARAISCRFTGSFASFPSTRAWPSTCASPAWRKASSWIRAKSSKSIIMARARPARCRLAGCASIPAPSTKWCRKSSSATGGICPKMALCFPSLRSTGTPAASRTCRRS
jgi:ribonuclease J